jgi:tRNA G18 (ribose-2'-O)-methylase SpoU
MAQLSDLLERLATRPENRGTDHRNEDERPVSCIHIFKSFQLPELMMRKLQHHEIPRADPSTSSSLRKHPIHVVADNIRSIHNVGSLFRTADAAGIAHLHLCGYTGTPNDRRLYKTALGAEQVVEWTHHSNAHDIVEHLKKRSFRIAALEITTSPRRLQTLTPDDYPMALVIGNEIDGVSEDLVGMADFAVEIPQFGIKQSLNVAVAFGIAAFDLVRIYRRLHDLPEFDTVGT